MRWKRGRGRGMIEDRRGQRPAGLGIGRGMGFPVPGGGIGLGTVVLLAVVIGVMYLTGALGGGDGRRLAGAPDPDAELADFVGFVVEDVQTAWQELFREDGRTYQVTTLVLFEEAVDSGCGVATSDVGPFYCPADRKVYLDLGFFRALGQEFDAPGDFAQAYVIAHEFGHHVQTLLGTEERVRREQRRSRGEANELSVRMELQADCYAGVWAQSAYEENLLETGDLEEALRAAAAIGDDRIQRSAGERVDPETWTHGSSEQRRQWFQEGYARGDPGDCDTFSASI